MLCEVDANNYFQYFPIDPHPFISNQFVELNSRKTERVVRLVRIEGKKELGLIAGVKGGILLSPFSAPFGGFHFRTEIVYIDQIDAFLHSLKMYIYETGINRIEITLPPDLYHPSFNAKSINCLLRNGFDMMVPDITCHVNLETFNGIFSQKNSRECYRQGERSRLCFNNVNNDSDKEEVYEIIKENRARYGRPIYMTLADIMNTSSLWPVDFFKVTTHEQEIIASAIFYRNHPKICYAVFWGDSENGRKLKAMDFLIYNLYRFYKNLGFTNIDLGTSTEAGIPNIGLLRFKESHEATSSLRYRFVWNNLR